MNKKRLANRILLLLAAALTITSIFVTEAFADRGKKHHERWEQEEHGYFGEEEHDDDDEWEEDDWDEDDYKSFPAYQVPSDGAGFTDRETVTLSFPDGVSASAVISVKQGQLFVPAQQVFDAHKVPYIVYPKGSILEGFANGEQFIFHADKRAMYLDGKKKSLAVAPYAMAGQFYIPLNAAAEALGYAAVTEPENKLIKFR